MARLTASERIKMTLLDASIFGPSEYLPVHSIASALCDVSACSVSARLRELARAGIVEKRKAEGKPYDEWALVKSERDPEDFI